MEAFYKKLLENNKIWVAKQTQNDPDFFTRLVNGQKPPILWIGCADSRVPANEIIGAQPGDVFVHRNIANMVIHTDMSMLSVLDYAINILEIQHVIVCGHYGCGGVQAAMTNKGFGIIDNWIRHIKDVYRLHKDELFVIKNEKEKFDKLVELNVQEQLYNLAKTSIIQSAWDKGRKVYLHGWVYELSTGLINDLNLTIKDNATLPYVHQLDF